MKFWIVMALSISGCSKRSDQSTKPDTEELSTFDQFTRWGLGIGGFAAPPSSGAATEDTASWGGDDGDWEDDDGDWDTGGWGGGWGIGASNGGAK